ncbi:MAG: DUF1543 domain-containing protein [Bacteriovoracaceae bacterium]
MGFVDKFSFTEKKLMAFYLGGRLAGINIECHDIQFYVGKDYKEVLPRINKNWKGTKSSLHIDSWIVLDQCDQHDILLSESPSTSKLRLYLLNIGYYKKQSFGEYHEFLFVVASSKSEAKNNALAQFDKAFIEAHMDDLFDVDDCIEVSTVDNLHIHLRPNDQSELNTINNGWQRIPKEAL